MNHYISDCHFYHSNIIRYCDRPFVSVEEMNDVLVSNINAYVKEKDWLYYLGDWAFGRNTESLLSNAVNIRHRIKCKNLVLAFGNHDRKLRNASKFLDLFRNFGDIVQVYDPYLRRDVVCSHYAMLVWNKCHVPNNPPIHCFGHSHGNLNPWMKEHLPKHLSIDVGVDNTYKTLGEYRPFSSEDLKRLLF